MDLLQPEEGRLLAALHCLLNGHVASDKNDRHQREEQARHPGGQFHPSSSERGNSSGNSHQQPYRKQEKTG
jgi:hypothetical protein